NCPSGVTFPTVPTNPSVNHMFPSGPSARYCGPSRSSGSSVITPSGVIFAIAPGTASRNQRLPSEPTLMKPGKLPGVGIGNDVNVSVARSKRHTAFVVMSVNQIAPSGPVVMPPATPNDVNTNSLIFPFGVIRLIVPFAPPVNQTLPSGPAVIACGKLKVRVTNSVIIPEFVTRAT